MSFPGARAQTATVTGRLEFTTVTKKPHGGRQPVSVVWLTAASDATANAAQFRPDPGANVRLTQHNKRFEPHLLVVPVGTAVEFPNRDPFFHNVFSLFEGKRFDLGLYEAGSSRMVHFDRPGISYIFCNIHPEMSAVVISLNTRFYAISDPTGRIAIPDVPAGRYNLHVWSEQVLPDSLDALAREVTIGPESSSLGTLRLTPNADPSLAHKNKYGRDYDQPAPSNPVYPQP